MCAAALVAAVSRRRRRAQAPRAGPPLHPLGCDRFATPSRWVLGSLTPPAASPRRAGETCSIPRGRIAAEQMTCRNSRASGKALAGIRARVDHVSSRCGTAPPSWLAAVNALSRAAAGAGRGPDALGSREKPSLPKACSCRSSISSPSRKRRARLPPQRNVPKPGKPAK